jgi:hypothetical protein
MVLAVPLECAHVHQDIYPQTVFNLTVVVVVTATLRAVVVLVLDLISAVAYQDSLLRIAQQHVQPLVA